MERLDPKSVPKDFSKINEVSHEQEKELKKEIYKWEEETDKNAEK